MSKKHVCVILLVMVSGLALASCASNGGGNNHAYDDGGDCTRRAFPQCGPSTTPNVPSQQQQ